MVDFFVLNDELLLTIGFIISISIAFVLTFAKASEFLDAKAQSIIDGVSASEKVKKDAEDILQRCQEEKNEMIKDIEQSFREYESISENIFKKEEIETERKIKAKTKSAIEKLEHHHNMLLAQFEEKLIKTSAEIVKKSVAIEVAESKNSGKPAEEQVENIANKNS